MILLSCYSGTLIFRKPIPHPRISEYNECILDRQAVIDNHYMNTWPLGLSSGPPAPAC